MADMERTLIETFQKGNYKPLIMEVLNIKWKKQEKFTWREIYLELQEITKTEHNMEFAQSLRECLHDVQVNNMFYSIAGTFVPAMIQ